MLKNKFIFFDRLLLLLWSVFFILVLNKNIIQLLFLSVFDLKIQISKFIIALVIFFSIFFFRFSAIKLPGFVFYLVYSVLVVIMFLTSGQEFNSNYIDNLRIFLLIPMSYFFVASLFVSGLGKNITKAVYIAFLVTLFFNVILIVPYLLGVNVYEALSLHDYFNQDTIARSRDLWNYDYNIPRSWISWDFYDISQSSFVRFIGVFLEPASSGRFYVNLIILTMILNFWKNF